MQPRPNSAKKSPTKRSYQEPTDSADISHQYVKTEILRRSIIDVKTRAAEMHSPKKYDQVKSKVAGNFKSQSQAKKRNSRVALLKAKDELITEQLLSGHKFIGSNGEYEGDYSGSKASP